MTSFTPASAAHAWWENTGEGGRLVLHLGKRRTVVPSEIAAMLLDEERITSDVAADLLYIEAELRDLDNRLSIRVAGDATEVARARRELAGLGQSWFGRGRRAEARTALEEAMRVHAEAGEIHAEIRALTETFRAFVIALDVRDGLLAEAAAGWARSPAVPAGVSVFEDVAYFLTDTRRATGPRCQASTVGGEVFGELWRRDGDDPVEQPLARAGCWQVGYIERTGEIYAARRCESRAREVWLLGRNFSIERAHDTVVPLMPRMQEPNSVILVAETVVSAAHDHDDTGGL